MWKKARLETIQPELFNGIVYITSITQQFNPLVSSFRATDIFVDNLETGLSRNQT